MPNNMTAFVPQRWSKRVLTKLDRKNVMLQLVNRDFEGDIKRQGDTVWVRTYGNVTVGNYSRNDPIDYGNLAPSRESLTVNDAKYFAIALDDLDDAQMDLNALDGYTDRAAVAMSEIVEDKLQAQYTKAHTSNRVTSAGSAITITSSNAYTTLVDAGKALDLQNVDSDGRWAIVTANYKAALLKDKDYFIRATDLGDEVIRSSRLGGKMGRRVPGLIGQCAGFDLYHSNATPSDVGGRYCMFGGGRPISYAGQIRKIEKIRRQDTFADAVRGLILHDATVFAEHAKMLGYIYVDQ